MEQDLQLTELDPLASIPASGALVYVRDENEAVDTDKDKKFDLSVMQAEIDGKANSSHTHSISDVTNLQTALDGKEPSITEGTTSQYFRGDKTFQTLDKNAVGLGNVDNTSDLSKPISTATQTALDGKASLSHTHVKADITDLSSSELVPSGGTDGQVVTKVAGVPAWADAAGGGGGVWEDVTSTSITTATNIVFSSLSGYRTYRVLINADDTIINFNIQVNNLSSGYELVLDRANAGNSSVLRTADSSATNLTAPSSFGSSIALSGFAEFVINKVYASFLSGSLISCYGRWTNEGYVRYDSHGRILISSQNTDVNEIKINFSSMTGSSVEVTLQGLK